MWNQFHVRPLIAAVLLATAGLTTAAAEPSLVAVDDATSSALAGELDALTSAFERGEDTEAAVARFLANDDVDSGWELRARIAAAEHVYRDGGDPALLARLLPAPALATTDGFLRGYAEYLLGLAGGDDAELRFQAAFEHAGTTLLRHRAGLWLAQLQWNRGDAEAALELLEALPNTPLGARLEADLTMRRSVLLEALGRPDEALALMRSLYLDRPRLALEAGTKELVALLEKRLGDEIGRLPGAARAARVEALLDARGGARFARAEARALLTATDLEQAEARYLLARSELAQGSPRRALAEIEKIPRRSGRYYEARYLRAEALRKVRRSSEAAQVLASLAADADAGPTRYRAAARLAGRVEDKDPARARKLWKIVAAGGDGGDGDDLDAAHWWLGWDRFRGREDDAATRWFGRLIATSNEPVHIARGMYWSARALERGGRVEDARILYEDTFHSQPRGFYGYAASERLRAHRDDHDPMQDGLVSSAGPAPDPIETAPPSVLEALAPGRELLALGLFEDAIAELEFQASRFPGRAAPRVLIAEAYHARNDFMTSVRWLKRAFPDVKEGGLPNRYWTRLYPLEFWQAIQKNAAERGLDPYFVAAVMYQESRFQHRARSAAGAVGLMQVMPRTGQEIARNLREGGYSAKRLYDPERNMRYGMYYLRKLLDRNDGRPELALAAYNAGQGRVKRWTKKGALEMDEFIEEIPFRETRLYVKNILVAHDGYHRVYDGSSSCALELNP